jgi:hypothetical protein
MSNYADIVKTAAQVETAKTRIVQYARKCAFLRQEPDEAESEEMVKAFFAAQDAYHASASQALIGEEDA